MDDAYKDEADHYHKLEGSSWSSNLLISSITSSAVDIWNCSSSSIEVVDYESTISCDACSAKKSTATEEDILKSKFGIKPSFVKLTPISTDKLQLNSDNLNELENIETDIICLSDSTKNDEELIGNGSPLDSFKLEYISDDDVGTIENSSIENTPKLESQEKYYNHHRFEGDLVWAKTLGRTWWPAQITMNTQTKDFKRVNLKKHCLHKNTNEYHVTIFETSSRSYWVSEKNLLDFRGRKNFEDNASSLRSLVLRDGYSRQWNGNYWVKPTIRKKWEASVKKVEDEYKSQIEEQMERDLKHAAQNLEIVCTQSCEKLVKHGLQESANVVDKCLRTHFLGEIVWVKLPGRPWWPARISKEQESQDFQRTILVKTKESLAYHITTFDTLPTSCWVKSNNLFLKNFRGRKKFENYINKVLIQHANNSPRYARLKKLYRIPCKYRKQWNSIVDEVETTYETQIKEQRVTNLENGNPKSNDLFVVPNSSVSIDETAKRLRNRFLGEIVWVKLPKTPWWPSQITIDKKSGDFKRTVLLKTANLVQYHITTFGSSSTSCWVKSQRSFLMDFRGGKKFRDYVNEVLSRCSPCSPNYARLKQIYRVPVIFRKKWKKVVRNVEKTFQDQIKEQIERDFKNVQLCTKLTEIQTTKPICRRSSRLQFANSPKKTEDSEKINAEYPLDNLEKCKMLLTVSKEENTDAKSFTKNLRGSQQGSKFRHRFVGELVWAKLKDKPWWPAKISEFSGEYKRVNGEKYASNIFYHITTFDTPSKNCWVAGSNLLDFKGRKVFEDYANTLMSSIPSESPRFSHLQWKFSIKEKFRKKWEKVVKMVEDNYLISVEDQIERDELVKGDTSASIGAKNVKEVEGSTTDNNLSEPGTDTKITDNFPESFADNLSESAADNLSEPAADNLSESAADNSPESFTNKKKDNIYRFVGDLVWVKTVGRPWLPAQISTDKESGDFKRNTFNTKSACSFLEYHVTIFQTPSVRCWALASNLLDFRGKRNFEDYKNSLLRLIPRGSKSYIHLSRKFYVSNNIRKQWESVVKYAESIYHSQIEHQVVGGAVEMTVSHNAASRKTTCTKEIAAENVNENYVPRIIKYLNFQMLSCDELITSQDSKSSGVEMNGLQNRFLGDLVWIKTSSNKYWPAEITEDDEWGDSKRNIFISKNVDRCTIQYHITTFGIPSVSGWVLGDRLLDFQGKKTPKEIITFLRSISCDDLHDGLNVCVNEEYCKKWEDILNNIKDIYLFPFKKEIKKDLKDLQISSKKLVNCIELEDAQPLFSIDPAEKIIKRYVEDLVWVKSPGRPWWPAQISKSKESGFKRLYQQENGRKNYVQYHITTFGTPSINYWAFSCNLLNFFGVKKFMDLNLNISMEGVNFKSWLELVQQIEDSYKYKIEELLERDLQDQSTTKIEAHGFKQKFGKNDETKLKKRKLQLENEKMCSFSNGLSQPKKKTLTQVSSPQSKTRQKKSKNVTFQTC